MPLPTTTIRSARIRPAAVQQMNSIIPGQSDATSGLSPVVSP